MRRTSVVLIATALVLALGGVAQAAAVHLVMTVDPSTHTFDLTAQASLGDNGGISGFDISLVSISSATNMAPKGAAPSFTMLGFWSPRTNLDGPGDLAAAQSIDAPDTLIYEIGQIAGSAPVLPGSEVNIPWDAPVLLGTGTYVGETTPNFGAKSSVSVFQAVGVPTNTHFLSLGDGVTREVNIVPEPGTLALLATGLLGLVCYAWRRRR